MDSAGLVKCCFDVVHHVHSAADCLIHLCSHLLHHICHFLSQLLLKCCEVCWGDHICSLFCWSCCYCCCYRRVVLGLGGFASVSTRGVTHRRSATMSNATLFCGTLEPTRMRWEDDQVRMSSLETREANVQECNGVKYVCNSTQSKRERE